VALSLKDLQEIMSPLTELGKGESSFEVNGLTVVLRTLTPEEEIATQRYARGAITEGDVSDQVNALDYLDRFRTACLGYAITQIGDADFRGVSVIETGEKLPNGVAVKIKKHEALMKVVETWSRQMTTAVFQRFTSLTERVESEVDRSLKYDDDHIDAEISRLEERLVELRSTKAKKDTGKNDPRQNAISLAANKPLANQAPAPEPQAQPEEKETWETARGARSTDEEPSFVAEPLDIPKSVAESGTAVAEQPAQPRRSLLGDAPPVRPVREEPKSFQDVKSSMVDAGDEEAVEAENLRLARERAMRPKPPHLSAREVAKSIEQAGSIEGVPVFKMPMQELTNAGEQPRPPAPAPKSAVNPNFRPAKK
jgi:hypothetical protein